MNYTEIKEYHKWMSKHEMTYIQSRNRFGKYATMIRVKDSEELRDITDVIQHFRAIIIPQIAHLNFKLILITTE